MSNGNIQVMSEWEKLRKMYPELPKDEFSAEAMRMVKELREDVSTAKAEMKAAHDLTDILVASINYSLGRIKRNAPWLFSKEHK